MLALPGFSPAGTAAPVAQSEPQSAPRADTCAEQAWPYYDASCLRRYGAAAQPAEEARVVRIVRPDRLTR